jgi:signal transduction histidine kinase
VVEVLSRFVKALRRAVVSGERIGPVDIVPVVVLLLPGIFAPHHGGTFGVALSVALVVPLLWRRRAPIPVFCVVWMVAAVQGLITRPTGSDAALLVAFYTVAATAADRTTILLALALEAGVVATSLKWTTGASELLKVFVGLSGLVTAAGVLGINVRNRRRTVAGLRERARQLEHDREREVALAQATERARIAREMHDVIAHNVSVMVALCDGAGYRLHDAPEQVEAALQQAAKSGREALAEMRQLLGVLRESPELPELAPLPGIRDIENLVELIRAAGVPVSYTLSGDLSDAPPGMELAIYRIVQEALTNTLKHAGAGANASVIVSCDAEAITVDVRDNGRAGEAIGAGGAGLRGMQERAAVYGGTLRAGPAPDGGWRVTTALAFDKTPVAAAR